MTDIATLRFRLKGAPGAERSIDAGDLSDFLVSLLRCLKRLEEESLPQALVQYRVVDLGVGSARLAIEPRSKSDANRSANIVARSFESGIGALVNGKIGETNFERRTKESFLGLLKPLSQETHTIEFTGLQDHVLKRRSLLENVLPRKIAGTSIGSVSGRIQALNVHRNPVFYLYPPGSARVACTFVADLLPDVLGAVEQHATVHGATEYEPDNPFPSRVEVDRLEVHPPDEALPALSDLYGAVPNLTGGTEGAAFIRALRDAET